LRRAFAEHSMNTPATYERSPALPAGNQAIKLTEVGIISFPLTFSWRNMKPAGGVHIALLVPVGEYNIIAIDSSAISALKRIIPVFVISWVEDVLEIKPCAFSSGQVEQ
jgi:hypothetical protein